MLGIHLRSSPLLFVVLLACSRVPTSGDTPKIQLDAMQEALRGSQIWSRSFGGPQSHYGRSVGADGSGNVVITGEFSGSVDFGCGPFAALGSLDAFAAKFSSAGVCQWSMTLGSSGASQFGRAVTVDANDNILLVGDFRGSINFGSCGDRTSAGGNDIFLAKLSSSGNCLWASRFGDAASQFGRGIAVDSAGNVAIAGEFFGSIPDFGGGTLTSLGDSDLYVAKFTSEGAYQWAYSFGDPSEQVANSVAVDASNNLIVAGSYHGQFDFGGGPLPQSQDGAHMFLVKFNGAGAHLWSRAFGDSGDHLPASVETDGDRNIIVSGAFHGVFNFGPPPCQVFSSAGVEGLLDVFLAKFSPLGECLWSHKFGDPENQEGTSVAIGPEESIFLTGYYLGSIDFGRESLPYRLRSGAFLAKFDKNGTCYGSEGFEGVQDQSGQGLALDASGNVLLTGYFAGGIDFGGQPLSSLGTFDAFLVKFAHVCDGSNCSGCCDGNVCRSTSVSFCGIGGGACTVCDDKADNCATGQCRCGTGPLCGTGQRCVGGTCRCDSVSCPTGCCNGATCSPSAFGSCGLLGVACVSCDAAKADTCTSGQCRCGAQAACAMGQRCFQGSCRCDDISCPTGCCTGQICHIDETAACGTRGGTCSVCNTTVANNCRNGECRCGTQAACSAGQRCVDGGCRCDSTSCPSGCCDGSGVCRSGTELTACGRGGGACAACSGDTQCVSGQCACPQCGTPGSCHSCSCDVGYCGVPPSCHVCTCEDIGYCGDLDPTHTCAFQLECGVWPDCYVCSGAETLEERLRAPEFELFH